MMHGQKNIKIYVFINMFSHKLLFFANMLFSLQNVNQLYTFTKQHKQTHFIVY
jgi:hypothetical protein